MAVELPPQSPLFHAEHEGRYDRQALIRTYQERFDCRLIVLIDAIFPDSIAIFEELIYDADPSQDLHLVLASPGGDGETAVRLARSAQARCRQLTIVVPDQAKSAATILALGAHRILMGPTSDLGPVDPQFNVPREGLVSAKNILAAVEHAQEQIEERPDTFPLHAALLENVSGLMVQAAQSALDRTEDLVAEALKSNPDRAPEQVEHLRARLREPLVELPASHGAVFGARDAVEAGLPVTEADPAGDQWKLIWRLYAKYVSIGALKGVPVYEGEKASQVNPAITQPPGPPGAGSPAPGASMAARS